MTQTFNLADLLRDSAYKLTQFKPSHIEALEAKITSKETGKTTAPYVTCLVRGKPIKLTPEEAVRQLFIMVLNEELRYPFSRMELEYGVTFGREKKRADICIFDIDRPTVPYILVEVKKPKLKDGKEQLKSYCNATGAPMGVWSNGEQLLKHNPYIHEELDIKIMQGYDDLYRLRVGQYRLLYKIKQNELIVFVLKAGSRGDIYKDIHF